MRRLLPDPGPTTVPDQVRELDLISSPPADRPYVVTNFAVTVDGKTTLHGRSGAIGSVVLSFWYPQVLPIRCLTGT